MVSSLQVFRPKYCIHQSRDSSVGIALGYGLDDRGSRVRFPAGDGNFLFTTAFGMALGPTQPPIQWVPGALSLGVKWPGCETDHSPPSSAKVKNTWSYTSTPTISLHGVCVIKQGDKSTFLPLILHISHLSHACYMTCPSHPL
jgi:hypothetical protein